MPYYARNTEVLLKGKRLLPLRGEIHRFAHIPKALPWANRVVPFQGEGKCPTHVPITLSLEAIPMQLLYIHTPRRGNELSANRVVPFQGECKCPTHVPITLSLEAIPMQLLYIHTPRRGNQLSAQGNTLGKIKKQITP